MPSAQVNHPFGRCWPRHFVYICLYIVYVFQWLWSLYSALHCSAVPLFFCPPSRPQQKTSPSVFDQGLVEVEEHGGQGPVGLIAPLMRPQIMEDGIPREPAGLVRRVRRTRVTGSRGLVFGVGLDSWCLSNSHCKVEDDRFIPKGATSIKTEVQTCGVVQKNDLEGGPTSDLTSDRPRVQHDLNPT